MTWAAFPWIVSLLLPVSIIVFLVSFLVWMHQGRHDGWFARSCNVLMVPSGLLSVALILVTLRWF